MKKNCCKRSRRSEEKFAFSVLKGVVAKSDEELKRMLADLQTRGIHPRASPRPTISNTLSSTRLHRGRLQLAAIQAAQAASRIGSAQSSKRLSLERSMIIWAN